ncbi:YwqG family protein [Nocardia sp. NPDC051750]|uniref:YwqG family protein n=1 Tax=Nocardia sp. NPDC051750 TaxID=3364325 RepID=UPI0037A30650
MAVDYSLLDSRNAGLRDRLIASEREYVELEFTAEAPQHPWQSQLGGIPYLIDGDEYPRDPAGRSMTFLIQLNFADLPPLAGFPDEGLLQFFIGDDDMLGCRYGDGPDQFRVVYHPSIDTDWQPRSALPPIDPYCSPLGFDDPQPRAVVGRLDRMPVSSTDSRFATLVGEYDIDTRELNDDEKSHRLGGYPHLLQADDTWDPEEMLLLQLAEAYIDVGGWAEDLLIWGDGGVAYFSITEADLAARDFSRVRYYWAGH